MLLSNNKVADDGTSAHPFQEGQVIVDSLMKVVACYRHLASCIGGCTDSVNLRRELRQTQQRALMLSQSCRDLLTTRLRDRSLPKQDRREAELQWVTFSSCLELLYADMCKVYHMGNSFSVATNSSMVQTGLQGGTSDVVAHGLSLPELQGEAGALPPPAAQVASVEDLDKAQLAEEVAWLGCTLEDMELKVNVLHWMVEARGPCHPDPLSNDSGSTALLSVDEEAPGGLCSLSSICCCAAGLSWCWQ